jgi:hypothetical protein
MKEEIQIESTTFQRVLNQQDASNLLSQWDQAFQEEQAKAGQVASQAAEGLSQGALWGFIALVLGLLVAAWGGWAGTASLPRPLEAVPAVVT